MIAVIMAGGAGTRFWPLSRNSMPKQYLRIAGERSMIQLTVDRLLPRIPLRDIFIVTSADQVPLVRVHLPDLPRDNIIIEPFGMNTAPCIALSMLFLREIRSCSGDAAIVILPADHVIRDREAFLRSLDQAQETAAEDYLVTFGIVPSYPATGFGYIEAGGEIAPGVNQVVRFKEKPDLATAQSFIQQGNFFWNSGMFAWKLNTILASIASLTPEIQAVLLRIAEGWRKDGITADLSAIYAQMPRQPVDIAIMEPAPCRAVIPVDYGWSDVGSWKALAKLNRPDPEGNILPRRHFSRDARANFIQSNKFTAVIGVDNLCLVETDDALLITTLDRSEDVKFVVEHLQKEGFSDLL
ncbi:MAG: NTP transferase domain-containing protein [Candidatus Cloacimonetes bacterium]|nr:NTP transferase domain-containing protein [Candidatus Cloacimonadota bacterium]